MFPCSVRACCMRTALRSPKLRVWRPQSQSRNAQHSPHQAAWETRTEAPTAIGVPRDVRMISKPTDVFLHGSYFDTLRVSLPMGKPLTLSASLGTC